MLQSEVDGWFRFNWSLVFLLADTMYVPYKRVTPGT